MTRKCKLNRTLLTGAVCLLFACSIFAQTPDDEEEFDPYAAPPPAKAMSTDERTQLEAQSGLKDRTKLALAFMSIRLSNAEEANAKNEFSQMYDELGAFHALMDNTLHYLSESPKKDKTLGTLKRYEITLRSFAPRLAMLRREIPPEYDSYILSLLRYLRHARSKAIEPLFGETVIPNRSQQ